MSKKILLVGESWVSTASHIKGWDRFNSVTHHRGADEFIARVGDDSIAFEYMLCHEAAERFPSEADALDSYDTIILSDIGSNTLLLPETVWIHSRRIPNRLKAIRDYVQRGGGLVMVGGYYSFQGINGGARYAGTPVEDALPVTIHRYDDRREMPEGISPTPAEDSAGHAVLAGVPGDLPYVLGINEVVAKPGATTLLSLPASEAVIRCWWSANTARVAPPPGLLTSGPTGCRWNFSAGRASRFSGATSSPGRAPARRGRRTDQPQQE